MKITTGGSQSLFNQGISKPTGIYVTNTNQVLVASETNGTIYNVLNFAQVSIYATGLTNPKFMVVPEPSTTILAGLSIVGLVAGRRLRKA